MRLRPHLPGQQPRELNPLEPSRLNTLTPMPSCAIAGSQCSSVGTVSVVRGYADRWRGAALSTEVQGGCRVA